MASFLSIRGLRKTYGSVTAVADVSLEIARGEFVTFLGPSGSGKSTTLYAIAGFQQPSAGDVRLLDRELLGVSPHRRNIGMVFQRYTLFPHLTVAGNIGFPLRVRGLGGAELEAKVAAMLRLVRLDGFGPRMPAQLSGGQQQRVALARALAYDPPLLLMDEPLSALDKKLREEIQVEIRRIHRETGVTILYVTHDQEEALRLSDRIALFNRGRIEQVGTGQALYEAPATRFVAGFIGNSNFLTARLLGCSGDRATIAWPDGTHHAEIAASGLGAGPCDVVVMVRPERTRISREATGDGIAATVMDSTYLGESVEFAVRTGWRQDMTVRTSRDRLAYGVPGVGDAVRIGWDPQAARVFPADAM